MIGTGSMLRLQVGFAVFVVVGTTCGAQFYHRMGPPPSHYDLLKASDFCAIATLVGNETVGRRLSRRQLEELTDLGMTLGGARLRLRIDEYLCSGKDLTVVEPSLPGPVEIEIFRARDEVDYFSPFYLAQGRQGLLCGGIRRDQERIKSEFKLPDDRIYYRSSYGGYGLRPLDGDAPQRLLSEMRAFCKALRGKAFDEKLTALRALQAHATEPFAESVRQAIDTLATSKIRK